jgi:hypothetical protein
MKVKVTVRRTQAVAKIKIYLFQMDSQLLKVRKKKMTKRLPN